MGDPLFQRSVGGLGPSALARQHYTRLAHAFRPAPRLRFDGGELGHNMAGRPSASASASASASMQNQAPVPPDLWAHQAGVNALALERFEGRILVSGGSDATIRIWDLEEASRTRDRSRDAHTDTDNHTFRPVAEIARAGSAPPPAVDAFRRQHSSSATPPSTGPGHRFGVTHLSFYPFDAAAFLSSSFDQTLRLWATDRAQLSGSFDLGAKVYSHAVSPVADHLLVACATQHPAVRLVDLRSGAAVQSLVAPGQVAGAVLSVAWSPRHEHVLASGSVDGTVRIWDVRRASSLVSLLDHEDTVGTGSGSGPGTGPGSLHGHRPTAKAHAGPVNGLAWTSDGGFLVSAGHDRRLRVWDMASGANTLVSFGPAVRNSALASVPLFATPTGMARPHDELLFWPNESEILVFRLHDGAIVTRLRGMGPSQVAVKMGGHSTPADRSAARRNRVTSLVWRGAGGLGSDTGGPVMGGRDTVGGVFSGHMDGQIRAWVPQTAANAAGADESALASDDDLASENENSENGPRTDERDRKRRALNQAYRSLMGTQITFT